MKYSYRLKDIFECSEERAFKAPILGDATKFMKGYLFQPPVTGFEEDQTWGQINGIRYPISNGNLFVHKGRMFKDVILERDENKYWKWTIYDFEFKTMCFIRLFKFFLVFGRLAAPNCEFGSSQSSGNQEKPNETQCFNLKIIKTM